MAETIDQNILCEKSSSGASWMMQPCDEFTATHVAQKYNLPILIAQLLLQRNISDAHIAEFLDPRIKTSMPNPFQFQDMREGAERIVSAIVAGETIAIFGDYDVDGATSSALLYRYLRELGNAPLLYIPDRAKEGYGPNSAAFDTLKMQGASLIITVDCGTLAFEPLKHAYDQGLDVVVVDHHQAEARLPEAIAVINPNRLDECGDCRQLAAVGVCFLLLVAVQKLLEEDGYFISQKKPDLLSLLDIVAIGTVCDVVPLTGLNRSFVSQGLKLLNSSQKAGILALREVAGVMDKPLSASHIGFALGPRINAGGRVGRSSTGVELLTTDDTIKAKKLAEELNQYNAERRAIESHMAEEAMAQASAAVSSGEEQSVIIAVDRSWHQGIIGIVASRLKEAFHRPAIVISLEEEGYGKGSCRSVAGFDMGAAIISAQSEGLLLKGGGHAMAAGFSILPEKIDSFRSFINARYSTANCHSAAPEHRVEAAIRASGVTLELAEIMEKLAPFGTANPEPLIMLQKARLLKSSIVGTDHVKTLWVDESIHHPALGGISFRAVETQLGQHLLEHVGRIWNVLVTIEIDHWQGQKRVNMMVKDAALA